MPIAFNKDFLPHYGKAVQLNPDVVRITARNPSVFTFRGTNTYLIGQKQVVIIDPGPDNKAHFASLLKAIGSRPVSHILLTHSHADHAALALRLAEHFQAPIAAAKTRDKKRRGTKKRIPPAADNLHISLKPDIELKDGSVIDTGEAGITAIATPGHTGDHMAFALADTGLLFSGDHVMAWSTTAISLPDGSMKDYMASLDKLLARKDKVYLPGHGGPVWQPKKFVRALKTHRNMRERTILARIKQGDTTIDKIVEAIYRNINPQLYSSAALSVLAHLEYLAERGLVKTDGPPRPDSVYSSVCSPGDSRTSVSKASMKAIAKRASMPKSRGK